ncbi:MAG: phage holin family protein [Myxococcales bacterium]|nr:phage holin family protein [Myxococcales bacterium]
MDMVHLALSWLMHSAAVWVTAELLPGFSVKGFKGAMITAAVLGLLQVVLGWVLTLVIGIGSLGLGFVFMFATRWLVTAILLVLTDKLSESLKIRNFSTALVGAIVISVLTTLGSKLL